MRSVFATALLTALTIACTRGGDTDTRAPAPASRPASELSFSGCAAVSPGPVCELRDDRTLRIWLPSDARDVELHAPDPLDAQGTRTADGTSYSATIPGDARTLAIAATLGTERRTWSLPLVAPHVWPASITTARAQKESGDFDAATATLERAFPTLPPVEGAAALSLLARIDLARSHDAEARVRFEAAIDAEAKARRPSLAADDAFAAAHLLLRDRLFAEARTAIDRGRALSADYPDGRAFALYYDGLLARDTGDTHGASRSLVEAERALARLGLTRARRGATQARASVLLVAGRGGDAHALLAALDASDGAAMTPCDHADLLSNLGWVSIARAMDDADDPDANAIAIAEARPPLERALGEYRGACADARQASNVLSNLALAALVAGDVQRARDLARDARAADATPDAVLSFFWLDLDARVALACGTPVAALALYERLAALARAAGSPEDEWRAADGCAEALVAMNAPARALVPAAEAVRWADDASLAVPFGEGRGTLAHARERSHRRYVELLLGAGRVDDAFAAARATHARLVADRQRVDRLTRLDPTTRARWESATGAYARARAALANEAAGDWSLAATDLARVVASRQGRESDVRAALHDVVAALPRATNGLAALRFATGEVAIAYTPLIHGWAAFVARGDGVRVVRLGPVDLHATPGALAHALLDPLRAALDGASRVRLLVDPSLDALDVHALPWNGAPLVSAVAIDYGLDIDEPADAPEATIDPRALLVDDPTRDLPGARAEGDAVTAALLDGGTALDRLEGQGARRADVLARLASSSLLHYAGHGFFAGTDGADSALVLSDGVLTVADVLALPRVPSQVVLSGCETARAGDARAGDALGLAQAFLAAGSESVVASTRLVDDASARALMTTFYARLSPTHDAALALRDAQLAAAASMPLREWSAFRAVRR